MTTTVSTIDYTPAINPLIDGFRREQLEKVDLQVRAMEELLKRMELNGKSQKETSK